MPSDKNRSICADDVSTGTICSTENSGIIGNRSSSSLGRFAIVLKLAVALQGRGTIPGWETFLGQNEECAQSGVDGFFWFPKSHLAGWNLVDLE